MLLYHYTAKEPSTGKVVKASVQADSESSAAALVRKEGLVPLDIKVGDSSSGSFELPSFMQSKKVKLKEKVLFSRQLSTLINAGLPLVQALRNVASQTQGKQLRIVIDQVIADVEAGSALSKALAKHPRVFDQVYISLIEAGETSGTLDRSLERLAIQQEKDADIISKVRGAFIYPLIVMAVMIGVVIYMLLTVLPQVEILYDGISKELPVYTRMLLFVSDVIKGFWWLIAIVVGIGAFFATRWARTGPGKQVIDRIKMKAPLMGPLYMKMYMARFSRTGATLIGSGVPLIRTLEITSDAVNNVHIQASLRHAAEKVKGGKSLSSILEGDENFLELVPNMLHIGEESGATEAMLGKTADYYEKEVDNQIKAISTIIEPVLMVAMGIMALIIVAAVLLPVYTISGDSIL